VAYSVKQLAARLQSQLSAAKQIVSSAEVMIGTEKITSQLSREALAAASQAHQRSTEGREVLAQSITQMHQLSQPNTRPSSTSTRAVLCKSGVSQPGNPRTTVCGGTAAPIRDPSPAIFVTPLLVIIVAALNATIRPLSMGL
jgi:hypothetical protein